MAAAVWLLMAALSVAAALRGKPAGKFFKGAAKEVADVQVEHGNELNSGQPICE